MTTVVHKDPKRLNLDETLSQAQLKKPLEVFQSMFPDLAPEHLEAVSEIKVGVVMPRANQSLVKYLTWRHPRNSNPGITEADMTTFLQEVKQVASQMSGDWSELVGKEISRNWAHAKSLPNRDLWAKATGKDRSAVLSHPSVKGNDGFVVSVYPVILNPSDTTQVWGVGSQPALVSTSDTINPSACQQWLEENSASLQEEFGISSLPRVLRPLVRLGWTIRAPDGEEAVVLGRQLDKDWSTNPQAQAWTNERLQHIQASYTKAGAWAAIESINASLKKSDKLPSAVVTDEEWDLFDQKAPNDLAGFDRMMGAMQTQNPSGFAAIKQSYLSSVSALLFQTSKGNFKSSVFGAEETRAVVAERSWLSDEDLKMYIEKERESFVEACGKVDLLPYVSRLDDKERSQFLDLLYWNDCQFSDDLKGVLLGQFTQEDIKVIIAPEEPVVRKQKHSTTDWTELLAAFEVEAPTEDNTEMFVDHPFASWMMRLNPPEEVVQVTRAWIEDNEFFNEINRSILRKKEADESSMNTDLVNKLRGVIDTSNRIIQESDTSGGWWGRVRKNMGNSQGPSAEQWADVYLEFQDHILGMFEGIKGQVERDKTWLKYADHIRSSAQDVDKAWQKWLSDTATNVENERNNNPSASQEQKLIWNARVNTLESSQSAYEHIRTANGISNVLLEKVRQSVGVKERLQQRSMMFYWSSLNMFAGLQSLQRNTNSIGEQADFVESMAQSLNSTLARSLKEEAAQKEKIREAFKNMAQSQASMEQFYQTIASFQQDAVSILGDLSTARHEMQEETAAVTVTAGKIKQKMTAKVDEPTSRAPGMN